jgi:hypothetical protein
MEKLKIPFQTRHGQRCVVDDRVADDDSPSIAHVKDSHMCRNECRAKIDYDHPIEVCKCNSSTGLNRSSPALLIRI